MGASAQNPRVLLVGADESIAWELADFLREERCEVRVHLHRAGAELPSWPCDVLLADFSTGVLGGGVAGLFAQLRSQCQPRRVLALTLDRGDAAHADETFLAPFDLDALVKRLQAIAVENR